MTKAQAWNKPPHFRLYFLALLCFELQPLSLFSQPIAPPGPPEVLIRCDDIGMSHAVNMAFKEVAESGLSFSASVMVPCPWFFEAAELLKKYPNVSVGLHLTLNAEWRELRWGPVLGPEAVPSLVDSLGYFFGSRGALMAHEPNLKEVERELRAQIRRALAAGLKPDYVDYHMGAAVATPELRVVVEKLAAEFGLGISRYFREQDAEGVYRALPPFKTDTLVAIMNRLTPGLRYLLVFHVGQETSELDALTDLNTIGLSDMSKHRNGERKALLSSEFRDALKVRKATLLTYGDLLRIDGTKGMKRPTP